MKLIRKICWRQSKKKKTLNQQRYPKNTFTVMKPNFLFIKRFCKRKREVKWVDINSQKKYLTIKFNQQNHQTQITAQNLSQSLIIKTICLNNKHGLSHQFYQFSLTLICFIKPNNFVFRAQSFIGTDNLMTDQGPLDNVIFAILANSEKLVYASYDRTSEFFLNSNQFVYYLDEMKIKQVKVGIVTSINLQCSGQSSFASHKVAARFLENLQQITQNNPEINKIKIKLSGFDLSRQLDIRGMSMNMRKPTLIEKLTELLLRKINTLTSLEIRICNVKNCRVEDFKSIMEMGLNVQAKQLTNLSYELSDWAFAKTSDDTEEDVKKIYAKGIKEVQHDRRYQPTIDSFLKMLEDSFEKTMNQPLVQLKKFRLQISTWYYTDYEAERFFLKLSDGSLNNLPKQDKIPLRIQYFHNEFKKKVETLIRELMIEMTHMEIDLRNWNKKFQMGILKSSLLNISSQRVNPLSQISRKISNDTKKLMVNLISKVQKSLIQGKTANNEKQKNKKNNEDQQDKPKELYFVVVV